MRVRPRILRRAASGLGLLSALASAFYFGLGGLPQPANPRVTLVLGIVAPVALGLALAALQLLIARHDLRLREPLRPFIETAVLGVIFLFAVYHLSYTLRFLAPVAMALNALLPGTVMHWATPLPGLAVAVFSEAAWYRIGRGRTD